MSKTEAQSETLENKKVVYEIDIDGFQKFKLEKTKKGSYKGKLINHIQKISFIPREIRKKEKLSPKIAERLMIKLDSIGISEISKINCFSIAEDFEKFNKCIENTVSCLDGDITYFTIKKEKSIKKYNFDCISHNEKITDKTPLNRIKAVEILKVLNKEINLEKSFEEFKKKLPKGSYVYYGVF